MGALTQGPILLRAPTGEGVDHAQSCLAGLPLASGLSCGEESRTPTYLLMRQVRHRYRLPRVVNCTVLRHTLSRDFVRGPTPNEV